MKKYLTLAAALLLTGISTLPAANKTPNIVVIFADDMGYGDVSALNPDSRIQTPNLDDMAKDGMVFTDAHTSSSVCTPSRYSLLTGRYNWRTRLKDSVLWGYRGGSLMDPKRLNLASLLKGAGYNTAIIGKWHLGLDWGVKDGVKRPINYMKIEEEHVDFTKPFRNGPIDTGFDYFFGINASSDMPPYVYLEGRKAITVPTVVDGGKKFGFGRPGLSAEGLLPKHILPDFAERTVAYIEKQTEDNPFFVYMPLAAPHKPLAPTDRFKGKNILGVYGEFCMDVDYAVGQVLAALDRKGFTKNTLVIFTADNGGAHYHGASEFEAKGHYMSYIYRGYKADVFDGGHRVPFLVRWPTSIKAGSRSDEIICLTDLFATCAEITGQAFPETTGEDSLSFLPALKGGKVDTSKRAAIVHHSFRGSFAIRKGKWKLIFGPGSGGWGIPNDSDARKQGLPDLQLYDMEADPGEKTNLQSKNPEIVSALSKLMMDYVNNGRSTPGANQLNDGPNRHWKQLEPFMTQELYTHPRKLPKR